MKLNLNTEYHIVETLSVSTMVPPKIYIRILTEANVCSLAAMTAKYALPEPQADEVIAAGVQAYLATLHHYGEVQNVQTWSALYADHLVNCMMDHIRSVIGEGQIGVDTTAEEEDLQCLVLELLWDTEERLNWARLHTPPLKFSVTN